MVGRREIDSNNKFEALIRWYLGNNRWGYVTDHESRIINISSFKKAPTSELLVANLPETIFPGALKNLFELIENDSTDHFNEKKIVLDKASLLVALANNYTIVSNIENVLEVAIARCDQESMHTESVFLTRILTDEQGHNQLIENDVKGLGISLSKLMAGTQRNAAEALVALLGRLARGREPVAVLGVGYLLESNALTLDKKFFRSYELLVPEMKQAQSFFNVHSASGEEAKHFDLLLSFLISLETKQLEAVISAYEQAVKILAEYPSPSLLADVKLLKS